MSAVASPDGAPAEVDVDAARRLVDRPSQPVLDRITELAALLLGVRSSQVSVMTDVQTVVAGAGLAPGTVGSTSPRAESLCTVTTTAGAPVAVTDAPHDDRVNALPPVTSGQVGSYLGVPLRSLSGGIVGALCVFDERPHSWSDRDVLVLEHLAASARAELELLALGRDFDVQRARFDLAVQAGDIGSFDWDLTTGELDWDDRLVAMYGYDVGDVAFDRSIASVEARLHPDDAEMVATAMADAIVAVGPLQVLYRIVVPGRGVRWLEARGRALAGPDGTGNRLLGVSWDVTAQREADARAERVLASMAIGFLAVDLEWRITYVNSEGERLLGGAGADLVGRALWDLFPATLGSEFDTTYRRVAATRTAETLEAFFPAPLNAWYEIRVVPTAEGVSLYFLDITARHEAEQLLALSVQVAENLVGVVDVDAAVAALARSVVPRLADWSIVSLVDGPGTVRDVQTWHVDPDRRPVVAAYARDRLDAGGSGVVGRVIATGEPVVIAEDVVGYGLRTLPSAAARSALAELAPASAVVVPLVAAGVVAGVLTMCRGSARPPMTEQELVVTDTLCRRAGLAVDNARLLAARAAAAAHDRTVAQALQQALLPRLPAPDQVRLDARYLTAASGDQVGGDWYDAVVAPDGTTTVVIGDVVGHDITAAAVMGRLRTMLQLLALDHREPPSVVVARLDEAARTLRVDTMATLVVARVEPVDPDVPAGACTVHWTNAGHPPPVLVAPDGGTEVLDTETVDVLLGVAPGRVRHDHRHDLPRGATLVLYTDGLIETRTGDLGEGIARLRAALTRHHDPVTGVPLDAVIAEMVGDEPADDVAVLAVRLPTAG